MPVRSNKPLTEISEFKFNVNSRALERAEFDKKVREPFCAISFFVGWLRISVVNGVQYPSNPRTTCISLDSLADFVKLHTCNCLRHLSTDSNEVWHRCRWLRNRTCTGTIVRNTKLLERLKRKDLSERCAETWLSQHVLYRSLTDPSFPKGI